MSESTTPTKDMVGAVTNKRWRKVYDRNKDTTKPAHRGGGKKKPKMEKPDPYKVGDHVTICTNKYGVHHFLVGVVVDVAPDVGYSFHRYFVEIAGGTNPKDEPLLGHLVSAGLGCWGFTFEPVPPTSIKLTWGKQPGDLE